MATRTKKVSKVKSVKTLKSVKVVRKAKKIVEPVVIEKPTTSLFSNTKVRIFSVSCVLILGLLAFWYKTKSWPIIAVVNYMPITRFELDQLMYGKVGKEALDALITQKLVDQELMSKKMSVTSSEIDARLEEIKKQLGTPENFNQILELQGVTQVQLREQIDYQLKLEKLVPVSTDSAKMQADISATLSGLRSKAKIWVVK